MKTKSAKTDRKKNDIISAGGLIIATGCLLLALSSCTPRSVRYSNDAKKSRITKTTTKTKTGEENPELADDKAAAIKEFENKINSKKKAVENTGTVRNVSDQAGDAAVLPTLKDQLNNLTDEQIQIKNKVVVLQNDVIEVKYALEEIKDGLRNANLLKKNKVYSGAESDAAQAESSNELGAIPSDEEAAKVSAAPKVEKATAPAKTAKKVIPVKKSDVKSVSKKDKTKAISMKAPSAKTKAVEPEEPKSVAAKTGDVKSGMSDALACISKKDYKTASQKMTEILKTAKDPSTIADCNYWLGECTFQMKDYTKALEYYNKVVKQSKSPAKDGAQVKIAECLIKTGQIPEARAAFKTLIDKYPGSEYIPKAKKMLQQL